MVSINLPFGGQLQTEGKEYKSGAYVHVLDQTGEITFRAISQEFGQNPKKTMQSFLEALEDLIPNQSTEPHGFQFKIGEVLFEARPHEVKIYYTHPQKTLLLQYAWQEWQDAPEEVIGALINCMEMNYNPT